MTRRSLGEGGSRLKSYPVRRVDRDHGKITFGQGLEMAGRLVLMDLDLELPVFIGQPVGFQPQVFELPVEALRLNIFPDTQHKNAKTRGADLGPLANGFTVRTVSHNFSKILNLALRALGFSCISSSDATITLRFTNLAQGTWPQMHCGTCGGQTHPLAA
jgi:hypothetical protein